MRQINFTFLLLLFIGCQQNSSQNRIEFNFESGEIRYVDSVSIDEDGSAFNFVLNPKVYQDSLLVFGDGSFSAIHLYNTSTGDKIKLFSSTTIEDYPLPTSGFSNSFVKGDSIYLLNVTLNKILIFNFQGKYLDEIELNNGENNFVLNYLPFFDQIEKSFFISRRMDASMSENYREGMMLSKFSASGSYEKSFGTYPKKYSEGGLALVKGENVVRKGNKLYVVNPVGIPILKEYSLDGELLNFYEFESEYFDPTIYFFESSPFDSPLLDQFLSLSTDSNSDDKVFYLAYAHFNNRDPLLGENSFRLMLIKIDLNSKTIKEKEILGPWHYFELRSLLREVKGDTLSLLVRGMDENLYLKRFLFD
jgi:hypothetical protein